MQTIGERLEEARKRKGISIREAAEATKIRGDYLQKFENNQFDINLSELYVRGFLRTYSHFLKLPAERIVSDYRALGHPGDEKPRMPSREVFGRLDLSIASSGGKSAEAPAPEPTPEPAEPRNGEHNPRTFARIGTSLPTGTFIDGRIVMKIGAIVGAIVVILLVVWGIKSLTSSEPSAKPAAASQETEPKIVIYALDTVRVKVVQVADGRELFQGTLVAGGSRALPKKGSLYITFSEGKNVQVEVNGKRYPMPSEGYGRAQID